jgi:hypothetical protein
MALRPSKAKVIDIQVFDPTIYSIPECQFLIDNLGKEPVVALRSIPPNVNEKAIRPIMQRVHELQRLQDIEGIAWTGVEPLKAAAATYVRENAKWKREAARNRRAPRYPSLYTFDAKGRGHKGGPGSDCHTVKSYFDETGARRRFEVFLFPEMAEEWVAPAFEAPSDKRLTVDGEKNRIECFCGHTESFKPESRSSYSAARARISKHLRTAKDNVEDHREIHTLEFGGNDLG